MIARITLGLFVRRSLRSLSDPRLEQAELSGTERLPFRRHPLRLDRGRHPLEDQTLNGFAHINHRAVLAPFRHQRDRIQPQPRLLLECPVTGIAPLTQHRLDLLHVIDGLLGDSIVRP